MEHGEAEPRFHPMTITPGAHIEIELVDDAGLREALALDVVPDEQADFANGFLGLSTPLSQALLGHSAGDVVAYRQGDVAQVHILQVAASARTPIGDAAARRQAVLQQAVAEAERVSDMVFALAVGSKWGDYDPGDGPARPQDS
jgi:hypothetical protein